eukprot:ANDGO_07505.mRNA.1 Presenilin-B
MELEEDETGLLVRPSDAGSESQSSDVVAVSVDGAIAAPNAHSENEETGAASDSTSSLTPAQRRRRLLSKPEQWSKSVLSVARPVLITMILTLVMIRLLASDSSTGSSYGNAEDGDDAGSGSDDQSDSEKIGVALLSALFVIAIMFVALVVMAFLYKRGYIKAIIGYMMVSTFILYAMLGSMWFYGICFALRIRLDWFTFAFCISNFAVGGSVCLFYYARHELSQCYLIVSSAMVAWWLSFLPVWTTWALLILLVLFDIAVVLAPKGPLKTIVETAQERNEPIPAPVYEGDGLKLGLGDFIFYTLLVARAALAPSGGFLLSAFVCAVSIFAGLGLTLVVLGLYGKALPALPISIVLGLIWYAAAVYLVSPFAVELALYRIAA